MKIGLLTAILDTYSFEQVVDFASEEGFKCLEVACWPTGKAERRYAGVSHIDVEKVAQDETYKKYILNYISKKNIEISALCYYPNVMQANMEKRAEAIEHLKKVIKAASILQVGLVNTFVGRDQTKSIEENMEIFDAVWPNIIDFAEKNGVKIGIENCPMLFGKDQWPGGQNIMYSPIIWKEVFERIPNKNFGLNFDPSHFVWQQMDYIQPLYEFKDRIFHIHFKDIKILINKLKEYGVLAYPLDYMIPKIPGLGDVNWGEFVSALTDIGYEGYACIEVEDRAFEGTEDKILDSIKLSKKYMDQYVI